MAKRGIFEDEAEATPVAPSAQTLTQKEEAYRVAAEGGKVSRQELEALRAELRTLRQMLGKG